MASGQAGEYGTSRPLLTQIRAAQENMPRKKRGKERQGRTVSDFQSCHWKNDCVAVKLRLVRFAVLLRGPVASHMQSSLLNVYFCKSFAVLRPILHLAIVVDIASFFSKGLDLFGVKRQISL